MSADPQRGGAAAVAAAETHSRPGHGPSQAKALMTPSARQECGIVSLVLFGDNKTILSVTDDALTRLS